MFANYDNWYCDVIKEILAHLRECEILIVMSQKVNNVPFVVNNKHYSAIKNEKIKHGSVFWRNILIRN